MVISWWAGLCVIAALNIAAWWLSARMLLRRRAELHPASYLACRTQVILAAVYVFGCAFRSVLPVFDVPRMCLIDYWLCTPLVGRSVATVAELCFVAQWAFLLREVAERTHSTYLQRVSRLLLPLIAVAEICSWYSVLTTSNLGHVIEESLWGLSAGLVVLSLAAFQPRCPPHWRPAAIAAVIVGSCYALYMFFIDVPMYWQRWLSDETQGRQYLTVPEGLADLMARRVVSNRWEDWKSEVVWMTLYFSIAVWISIGMIHALLRVHRARRLLTRSSARLGTKLEDSRQL